MTKKFSLVLVLSFFICSALSGCGLFESEESYKKDAVAIEDYQEFSRQPDIYKDKQVLLTQRVNHVIQNGKKAELITTPFKSDPLLINYEMKDGERQIQTGDVIRIWGTFKQFSSKKLIDFLPESKVIEIDAKYISLTTWGFIDNIVGQTFLRATTEQNQKLLLAVSAKKITPDALEWHGYITFDNQNFPVQGIVNDAGIGSFEYLDSKKNPTGAKGTLKITDQKKIEIQTDQAEIQVPKGFAQFNKPAELITVTLPAGTYNFN